MSAWRKSLFLKQTSDLLSLSPLRHSDGFASCKARCVLISASLPKAPFPGERLCMLCWLCICSIVVVCCRCVLHRLCSTTCMRPCIEPFGIHARHPCRGKIRGLASQKQGRFGCLPKVISKDAYVSWTEPLHDETAQTADFAEMQNQHSKQR